jgi:nucleoside-diphosphate-sugar epimerase
MWHQQAPQRKLSIIRPAVIFGPGEGGNFTRIANALEKGFFAYPGRKDTIKGCLYVKDICRFIIDRINNEQHYSCFNFCYPEKITIEHIVKTFKKTLNYKAPEVVIPFSAIKYMAAGVNVLPFKFVKNMGLVPERILKLVRSTNISSQKLIESGFKFQYSLEDALKDWSNDCGGKTLY